MTSCLIEPAAYSLVKKYRTSVKHLERVTEALDALVEAIEEKYGKELVPEFEGLEADWKEKVVDPRQHEGLENPYDMPRPTGKCCGGRPRLY